MLESRQLLNSIHLCIKRGLYIDYKKYSTTVTKVVQILREGAPGDVDIIVAKIGFKRRTMHNWRRQLKLNLNFNPLSFKVRFISRIFNDDEEDSIALYILSEKITKRICITDENRIDIITQANLIKHYNDEEFDFEHNASNGYIDLYKAHNNDEIKEEAATLRILLHFIPTGFKSKFKLLDAIIFSII